MAVRCSLFSLVVLLVLAPSPSPAVSGEHVFVVTTVQDDGPGSLREAIITANRSQKPSTIKFDSPEGVFATPQTIVLEQPLPPLVGELTLDGSISNRLWKAAGVTISAKRAYPVLQIEPEGRVVLKAITITQGNGERGGGIINRGVLVVKGATFLDNRAAQDGGALANLGGRVQLINSTFIDNRAGNTGGAFANHAGQAIVTNCTFSDNGAPQAGAIDNNDEMLLRNTILANSAAEVDCLSRKPLGAGSNNNLIEAHQGCGTPLSSAEPRLGKLGYYNGPTVTIPLTGASPAINMGDNDSALDEFGQPLKWDQRGSGDPRYVAGFTDIGAFEFQAYPELEVDVAEDVELRSCTSGTRFDCSLRGALALANAMGRAATIRFNSKVFSTPQTIRLQRELPEVTIKLVLDGSATAGVTIAGELKVRPETDGSLTFNKVATTGR